MKGWRGIIFDCDGVLFESRAANLAYYNVVLEYFGEPAVTAADEAKAHLCHTAASPVVFNTLLGAARLSAALNYASTIDYRQFIPYMTPEPNLIAALTRLAREFPLAIATNRGTSMPEVLRHFQLEAYFQHVLTSRDVPRPKPYPDMLLAAASKLRLETTELLFVGDSDLDRQAARQAGMAFVAYKGSVEGDLNITDHQELVHLMVGDAAAGIG